MLKRDLELERHWQRISDEQDPYHATYRQIGTSYSEDDYFQSGRRDVADWLARWEHLIARRESALDIGTGLGRLAFALAEQFERVTAIDITPRYLDLVRQRAEALGLDRLTTTPYDGDWARPDVYDFVLAICVFTQISDDAHLKSYFESIATALRRDGVALFHFDTRSRGPLYYLRWAIPDRALPAHWRKGFRRIRRDHTKLRALIAAGGLAIADATGEGSEFTYYAVRPAAASSEHKGS